MLVRIILAQALMLGLLSEARSQGYESEYNEDVDDRSDYTVDSEVDDRPDYSKYYVDDSSNQQQIKGRSDDRGFVTPIQFTSFFETPHFAYGESSNSEVLKPLVNQQKEESATGFVNENDFRGGFSPFGAESFGSHDYFEQAQKEKAQGPNTDEEIENQDPRPGPNYISHRVAPAKKYNYESEVDGLKQRPTSKASPYQKYSFQPVASTYGLKDPSILHVLQKAAAPFNPSYSKVASENYEYQPTEVALEVAKGKQCVRLNKEVSNKNIKQPMSCYVCKDQRSGAKSQYCSYESEPAPKSYYKSTEYSTPNAPYRTKREESKAYVDPYEEIKAKSHRYYSQPEEFDKDYYKAPDLSKISEPYYYSFEDGDGKPEKSYSEAQSEQLLRKGENCKKSTRDGLTCTVCADPKSGGNYEQCSYESQPNEKKYAYVKESKYDGDRSPDARDEERAEESEDEAKESESNKKSSNLEERSPATFDDYHLKLFPQFADQEGEREGIRKRSDFDEAKSKKDVEQVLEEFAKKDRSNCKEVNKKGMKCYLCVDQNGIKQEECMYVAESRPRRSYIAYHELQHLKSPVADIEPKEEASSRRRRRSVDQLGDETSNMEAAIEFVPEAAGDGTILKSKRNVNGEKVTESTDPQPQFDVHDEDGLYAAETKPVYSKTLGIYLPRYMLEKSELEKDFEKSFGLY